MIRRNVILQSAIAAALGLVAVNGAYASTLANANVSTFATQGIPSTGAVTINGGILYTATAAANADAGLLTITLPSGVTFTSTPSVTPDGTNFTAATVAGGGAGSNTLTINVTKANTANAGTVTLGAFNVTGATALASATATGKFEVTAQASGFTQATAVNDTTADKADLAMSGSQLAAPTVTANAVTIDVTSPSNGTNYVAAGNTVAGSGYIGSVAVSDNTYRNAANTAAYAFTATTGTAVVAGNYTGISSAYAVTPAAACATTAPNGSTAGTIAGSNLTFSGLTLADTYGICLIPNGTTLLNAFSNMTVTAEQDSSSTPGATNLGPISYNGTALTFGYVTSAASGYNNYIRISNPSSSAARLIVTVTRDDGTTASGVLNTAQGANTAQLYTPAQINAAVGTNIINAATDRAQVIVLSPAAITGSNLMFNPDGTVDKMP